MRLTRAIAVDVAPAEAWDTAVAGAGWAGPVRLGDGATGYAGRLRALDVDEDARCVSGDAQARRASGWGGVGATFELRPAAGGLVLEADVLLTGDATPEVADALLDELAARLRRPARGPRGADAGSPADDPRWRRRLAARAALAIAAGAAAGLAAGLRARRRA